MSNPGQQASSENEEALQAAADGSKDEGTSQVPVSVQDTGISQDTDSSQDTEAAEPVLRIRYRVRFGKTGLLRWISHRDLASLWERLVRRAMLKLSMTEGFHPKPRIAFPSALALGVESLDEVVELELAEQLTPQELLGRLVADNQPGLTIRSVAMLPEGFGKAQLSHNDYIITPPESADWDAIGDGIEKLLAQKTVSIARKKKTQKFDVPSNISSIEIEDQQLILTIANPDGAVLKPTDVLDLIGGQNWIEGGATITRIAVHLKKEYESDDRETFAASGDIPNAKAPTPASDLQTH